MPCWKQHLELLTVQRWTLPIKIGIKKTILGDSTLISYPESPVTTTYYISYTSCGISVVDTVVTIAEWQLFSGRLSCTKYPACKTGYDLAFIVHLPNIFSIYTSTRNIFLILYHCNKTVQKFKGRKKVQSFWILWFFHLSQWSFSRFARAGCGPVRCISCSSPKTLFGKIWNLANAILLF